FYTEDSGYDKILENSSPVFRYHLYNKPESSLAMTLFNNARRKLNLKTGQLYETAIKKFINNNDEINKWNFNHKYAPYKKTWEYVKKGVPTILGVAPIGGFWPNHAYIMYGYDD
ncbi:putative cysteine peptidase, partial [Mycoplasmopsis synoviae]